MALTDPEGGGQRSKTRSMTAASLCRYVGRMPGRSAPRRLRPAPVQPGTRYRVRITAPRLGTRRAWETSRGDFEQRLTAAEIAAVIGAEIEAEIHPRPRLRQSGHHGGRRCR